MKQIFSRFIITIFKLVINYKNWRIKCHRISYISKRLIWLSQFVLAQNTQPFVTFKKLTTWATCPNQKISWNFFLTVVMWCSLTRKWIEEGKKYILEPENGQTLLIVELYHKKVQNFHNLLWARILSWVNLYNLETLSYMYVHT